MARQWTKRRIQANQVIAPKDFNEENASLAELFNGGLGQHSMPLDSVNNVDIVANDRDTTTGSATGTTSSYGQCNSYHYTSNTSGILSTQLVDYNFKSTWNFLDELVNNGATLTLVTKEGMLRGNAVLDFERRMGYYNAETSSYEGRGLWTKWAVFVNGTIVAESGPIYPRRYTIDLPFITPIGSGDCLVRVAWRANTMALTANNAEVDLDFDIYNSHIWARNQFR